MNFCYPKYTHIVLWGSETLDSQRAFLSLSNFYEVKAFITSNTEIKTPFWNNIPYFNIDYYCDKIRNRSEKIIITLRRSENWKLCIDYLVSKGLKFFDDFNIYFLLENDAINIDIINQICPTKEICVYAIKKFSFGRKLLFINGNCQTILLQKYLLSNRSFNSEYACIDLPRICQINQYGEKLYEIAMGCADLCISQSISQQNKFSTKLATDYVREHIMPGAKLIIIPKLHFQGYFPQFKNTQDNAITLGHLPVFAYGDKYIDELLDRGECYEAILNTILDPNFLSEEDVNSFLDKQLEIYLAEEQICDVKLYDFISANCRKEILWHSFNHPTNKVVKELAERTLLALGIKYNKSINFIDEDSLDGTEGLTGQMQFIYPSVYKSLGIIPKDEKYFININSSALKLDRKDYIRIYCNSRNRVMPVIDVWGSCVSRELFNFTNKFKPGGYILQNPIHTFWRDPINIPDEKIVGTSNFTKKMALLEFKKKAVDYFNDNFKADYLMIDLCDCRNDVYVFNIDGNETFIGDSISIEKTIDGLTEYTPRRFSVFDIPYSYWETSMNKFVNIIRSKYNEKNIIINKFRFSEKYLDANGEIQYFKNNELYNKKGLLIEQLEEILIKLLPNAMVISPIEKPLAYELHKIGLSPMHYVDECYYIQNLKLERIFGMNAITDNQIAELVNNMEDVKL